MTEENRTSKACWHCGTRDGVYAINEPAFTTTSPRPWRVEEDASGARHRCRVALHGLVRCQRCGKAHCRDRNSVENMAQLVKNGLRGDPRPEYLKDKAPETVRTCKNPWQGKKFKPRQPRAAETRGRPVEHSRGERLRNKRRLARAQQQQPGNGGVAMAVQPQPQPQQQRRRRKRVRTAAQRQRKLAKARQRRSVKRAAAQERAAAAAAEATTAATKTERNRDAVARSDVGVSTSSSSLQTTFACPQRETATGTEVARFEPGFTVGIHKVGEKSEGSFLVSEF